MKQLLHLVTPAVILAMTIARILVQTFKASVPNSIIKVGW